MPDYYEVNPANTADIFPNDLDDIRYRSGRTQVRTRYAGTLSRISDPPPVQSNIYQRTPATNAPAEPTQYYELTPQSPLTVFSGAVHSPAARVVETNDWERIPIAELYDRKERELREHRNLVRLSACAIASQANWAMIVDQEARDAMTDINETLQDRLKDITIDGDPKAYWPEGRSTNVGIRHKTLGTEKLSPVADDAVWGALMKDKGVFGLSISEATFAVQEDIDAAFDANGGRTEEQRWNDLAAIDVTDQAKYGWPDYWP